jgi:hypothetical protein
MNKVIASYEYDPAFEADRLRSMMPHARHQEKMEEQADAVRRRREQHRTRARRPCPLYCLK